MRISRIYGKAFKNLALGIPKTKPSKKIRLRDKPTSKQAERIARYRGNPTPAEKSLAVALEENGIKAISQSPVGAYIADFLIKAQKLVIEADGPIHDSRMAYDQRRDLFMLCQGFSVMRFSNDDILKSPIVVVAKIKERLILLGAKR